MMLPINYREFYDVPRIFLVQREGVWYLFESRFDNELDDYSPTYEVYVVPNLTEDVVNGSWEDLVEIALRKVGTIAVERVVFDPTRRSSIDAVVFDIVSVE